MVAGSGSILLQGCRSSQRPNPDPVNGTGKPDKDMLGEFCWATVTPIQKQKKKIGRAKVIVGEGHSRNVILASMMVSVSGLGVGSLTVHKLVCV